MRHPLFRAALVTSALGLASPVLADDAYKGDATHNPNSNVLMHDYPTAANYCPAGLQPVTMGGVICCGTPNAPAYVNRAGATRKVAHHGHARSYEGHKVGFAPEGEKGVVYR